MPPPKKKTILEGNLYKGKEVRFKMNILSFHIRSQKTEEQIESKPGEEKE